ncbi:GNAT family N-acetyltransferase [Ruminococcus sp. Marseille-P6503]|uniref:GNAT family N-acetyltransferase n=1 Tax=Ruminococcus sp. Marseille-P6503 TaxID=2364796 RepID=UPI000F52AE50|nr:GNAT family N-acetyltransferase [Ruminococcus sp. Marseille-P6503]
MNIEITKVKEEEKEILRNLLEKYDYEFSQYDGRDVDENGNFGYEWLDYYWTEDGRYAYFIRADNKIAGFAMSCPYAEYRESTDYQVAEFCILPKYRKLGLGKKLAFYLWDTHKGSWEIRCHPKNIGSVRFWESIALEYSGGKCEIVHNDTLAEPYDDKTLPNMIYFSSEA